MAQIPAEIHSCRINEAESGAERSTGEIMAWESPAESRRGFDHFIAYRSCSLGQPAIHPEELFPMHHCGWLGIFEYWPELERAVSGQLWPMHGLAWRSSF